MTGEKNRYKTLDKMAGLNDKELSTPKHDELVLFLLKEDNLKKVIPGLSKWLNASQLIIETDKERLMKRVADIKRTPYSEYEDRLELKNIEKVLNRPLPTLNIRSEVPISSNSNSNFVVGFWDIMVEIYNRGYSHIIKGYYDLFNKNSIPKRLYIEVKPNIKSFGETLRQLNMYAFNEKKSGNIYLFTPDLRFKEQFESQGIHVISPLEKQTKLQF